MEEKKAVKYCLACRHEISNLKLNDYVQCHKCHSFNYISDQCAEDENKKYFNEMFKTLEERRTDNVKIKIFGRFAQIDQKRRKAQYLEFYEKCKQISGHLNKPSKVLEIGFGSGEHLYDLLRRGVDAYGIDISITAVRKFQEKNKQYADRVWCGSRFDMEVDVIYCSALFEHLDEPEAFIQDTAYSLNKGGILIIDGVPILNEFNSDLTVDEDINFWKPCHRAIYSLSGLEALFSRYGFINEICVTHDYYYYRILSLHRKYGYQSIEELRSFYMEDKDLPSIPVYLYICAKALRIKSMAHYGCIMFKKAENRDSI